MRLIPNSSGQNDSSNLHRAKRERPAGVVRYFPILRLDRPEILLWGFIISVLAHGFVIFFVRFVSPDSTVPYSPPVINAEMAVFDAIDEVIPDPWELSEGESEPIRGGVATGSPSSSLSFGQSSSAASQHQLDGEVYTQDTQLVQNEERTDQRAVSPSSAQPRMQRQLRSGLRPRRIRRLHANSDLKTIENIYLNRWQRKVESVGTLYFAHELSELSGQVTVLVSMEISGRVRDVRILKPSQDPRIDAAVLKVLRYSSPFPPLPDEIADHADILEIVRVWIFNQGASGRL
ncbi:MAG: energy transducer TonB family protein [Gammaproteobacteria bacterium]